jgi:hypothetical protein
LVVGVLFDPSLECYRDLSRISTGFFEKNFYRLLFTPPL